MIRIAENEELKGRHYDFAKDKVIGVIDNIISNGFPKGKESLECNEYEKKCLEYIKQNIEQIINGDIAKLKEIIRFFKANFECVAMAYPKKSEKPRLHQIITYVFVEKGYKAFCDENEIYYAYTLTKNLNIKSCPYCNRNYISTIERDFSSNEKKQDHS